MDFDILVRAKILRKKEVDIYKIRSLLSSAEKNAKAAIAIPLNENTATIIFREVYESIRQLGDANWRLRGYEPSNHEISLDGLKEIDVKDKFKLNYLSRFKKVRHDANYEGFIVTINQTREIIDFWRSCGEEIIKVVNNKLYKVLNKIKELE